MTKSSSPDSALLHSITRAETAQAAVDALIAAFSEGKTASAKQRTLTFLRWLDAMEDKGLLSNETSAEQFIDITTRTFVAQADASEEETKSKNNPLGPQQLPPILRARLRMMTYLAAQHIAQERHRALVRTLQSTESLDSEADTLLSRLIEWFEYNVERRESLEIVELVNAYITAMRALFLDEVLPVPMSLVAASKAIIGEARSHVSTTNSLKPAPPGSLIIEM